MQLARTVCLAALAPLFIALTSSGAPCPRRQAEGLPNIRGISIVAGLERVDGAVVPGSYGISFTLRGVNLAGSYSVQTPNGTQLALTPTPTGELRASLTGFGSLCAISVAIGGFSSFDFVLTGGADTVTLAYSSGCTPEPVPGYGDVLFPAHNQTDVALFPTLTWQCSSGPCPTSDCGNLAWHIELSDPLGLAPSSEVDADPCSKSWTPKDCLVPSTQYMLDVLATTLLLASGVTQTAGGDGFLYEARFEVVNHTAFTTSATLGTSYCMTAPNSAGDGARICASGSPVAAAADLLLIASGCPEDVPGLFYFGPNQLAGAPFGDGFRCVGVPMSKRMYPFAKTGPMNGSPAGTSVRAVDFSASYGASIFSGASLNFQYWYRDQMAMLLGYNLTDGFNIVFQ